MATEEQMQDWRDHALRVEEEVGKAIVGQRDTIRLINVALFARGHVLLEGDVGVGKTTILRAFARAIGGDFERVEGTVDLMPGDLVYHTYVDAEGKPRIEPGPLLRHGEATRVTSMMYLPPVFAVALELVFFGVAPDALMLAGMAMFAGCKRFARKNRA